VEVDLVQAPAHGVQVPTLVAEADLAEAAPATRGKTLL
jgi:hypothetical protein